MFRKIVSNLSFSPALVGQLGFYARRLRKEEATRRVGLIFVALALVVQSLAVFVPPESANAADSNDLVYGGIRPADGGIRLFLASYDQNTNGLRSIMDYFGITRGEIAASEHGAYTNSSVIRSLHSVNHRQQGSAGEQTLTTDNASTGQSITFFTRPLYRADNQVTTIWGFKGYSSQLQAKTGHGNFYLMDQCGNLLVETVPLPPPPPPIPPPLPPPPTGQCSSLTNRLISRTEFELTATANTANGATISKYIFTVKNSAGTPIFVKDVASNLTTARSGTITLNNAGTYMATVSVITSAGAKTSSTCATTIVVNPPPPPAAAECTSLTGKLISRKEFELAASATQTNGATISKYTFTVKNSAGTSVFTKDIVTDQTTAHSGTITLANAGEYTATVSVTTSLGVKTSSACTTKLTVAPPDKCPVNSTLSVEDKECQPCPANATIWIKDAECSAKIVYTKSSVNTSQGSVDATTVTAQQSDQIRYTIAAENIGLASQSVTLKEDLKDVLEYATLLDNGGGVFDDTTKTLTWPATTLQPKEKQIRVFTVRLLDTIPATARGASEPMSYDCHMNNVFGNTVNIAVACPTPKVIENIVTQLPHTGPTENIIFAGGVLAVVTYFYARTRQVNKEIRLIRRDLNAGTI